MMEGDDIRAAVASGLIDEKKRAGGLIALSDSHRDAREP
jgi:hypothetical protein